MNAEERLKAWFDERYGEREARVTRCVVAGEDFWSVSLYEGGDVGGVHVRGLTMEIAIVTAIGEWRRRGKVTS